MAQSKGTSVVVAENTLTLEQVEEVLLHGGALDAVSDEQMQNDMVRRILESDTLAAAFAEFKATPCKQMEGILLDIGGIAWVPSAFEEGPAVYALLKATVVESREQVTLSMGGRTLMASFVWAQRNAKMPIRGTFREQQSNTNSARKFWTFILADQQPGQ